MHKFLRAAGYSMYQKKKDIEKLLDLLETQPSVTKCVQIDEETNVCEMRTEIAPGIDLQRDILDQMEFSPIIDLVDGRLPLMDPRIFTDAPMGLGDGA